MGFRNALHRMLTIPWSIKKKMSPTYITSYSTLSNPNNLNTTADSLNQNHEKNPKSEWKEATN